jgi:putative hydrolase of the HAD superfamily
MPGIKAVVFDIGGVLEISRDGGEPTKPFKHVVARWESRLSLRSSELLSYLASKREDGATGRCSYDEWLDGLRAVMRADESQHDEFMRDFWNLYLGELNVELAEWFQRLRPRYLTGLLSNSFIGAREREQDRYAFSNMTDLIVYSHEEGAEKPDRHIYEVTWQRLGIEPEEMVFLDDVEEYVAGGANLGIQTVLYRNNAQAIAELEALLYDGS